jgi:hypothetical protein
MLRRSLIIIALLPLLYLGWCATHIPAVPDVGAANAVGSFISAGYAKFDNRQTVESTGKGKIYYSSPGSALHPTIILYEVTSTEDVATIEALAYQALLKYPDVQAISLHFHKEQNLTFSSAGAASRGWESAFKKVTVTRNSKAQRAG